MGDNVMATRSLLRQAVRDGDSKGYGEDRLDDLFALLFRGLVYAQIWEDPVLDMEALGIGRGERVVTIASGGCNAMAYLLAEPESIAAVDLNPGHVALTRLKRDAVRYLPSYEHYFRLFGIGADGRNVTDFYEHLYERLDPVTRTYWASRGPGGRRRIRAFATGIYREGLLGRFLTLLHRVLRLHGRRPERLLSARSLSEQQRVFEEEIAPVVNGRLVHGACRLPFALYGLGIPRTQFRALAACAGGDLPTLLHYRLERLACRFPVADNYFAWQAFGRRYDIANRRAVPPYLAPAAWEPLQDNATRLAVKQTSVTDYLAQQPARSIDRYVLLDAQDWMNPRQLRGLWEQIERTARPGARVGFRTGARSSPVEDVLTKAERARWHYDPAQSLVRIEHDRAGVYGGFHVYERAAP